MGNPNRRFLSPASTALQVMEAHKPSFLKFDFIGAGETGVQKPQCVVCGVVLSNE